LTQPDAKEPAYKRLLTGEDARKAAELDRQIRRLAAAGQHGDAVPLAKELAELRARVQGTDHWQASDARLDWTTLAKIAAWPAEDLALLKAPEQARELERRRQFAEARQLLEKLLDMQQRRLGNEHPWTARTHNFLGALSDRQGRYVEAERSFRMVLNIDRRSLGMQHPSTATNASWLGTVVQAQGRPAEAEPFFREALAIRRQVLGDDHRDTARSYNTLAGCLRAQARYAEAQPLYEQALALRRRVLGDDHAETSNSLLGMASNLKAQARYAEAGPMLQQVLAIRRRTLGDNHPDTAIACNELAGNLDFQGKHAEAETLYRESLGILRRARGDSHPDTARACNNLAYNLNAQVRYAEAEPLYREALEVWKRGLGDNHPDTAQAYNNVAYNLRLLGRLAEAEPLYVKALAIRLRLYGERHTHTAQTLNNLAAVFADQGKFAQAEPLLRRALAVRRELLGDDHPDTIRIYHNLAANSHAQGNYAAAEQLWRAALRGYDAARLRANTFGLDRATFDSSPAPYLAACLLHMDRPTEAWDALEQGLGRGLLDAVSARALVQRSTAEAREDQELSARLEALDRDIAALAGRLNDEAARERLAERTQKRDAAHAQLVRRAAIYAQREIYDRTRIQAQLPADAALVAWIDLTPPPGAADVRGEHWAAVLRRDGAPTWVRLTGSGKDGSWTTDDLLPQQLLPLLTHAPKETGAKLVDLARGTAAQRLGPLEDALRGNDRLPAVRQLILLPSHSLTGLPLEALTERYTVSYAPSGTIFARLREKPVERQGETTLLALGDPAFTRAWQALPGTRPEVEAIAELAPGSLTLFGGNASLARLQELAADGRLRRFRYLHLATHGTVDERVALQSALVLAGDRRLTAEQILRTWQLNADLVTLSACRTALGREASGEGYLGFSQALFLAGARSVVLSLWQVDDTATMLLMTRFYQNLLGKRGAARQQALSRAESLREAKSWLRNLTTKEIDAELAKLPAATRGSEKIKPGVSQQSADARPFAHPYYWSAFILIGDPG
jgi:CHAT domain-containing protein